MKAFLALICLFLVCGLRTWAQATEPQFFPPVSKNIYINSQSKPAGPLIMVGSQETAPDAVILNPDKIQSMEVLKGEKAVERFGEKGKEGVVVMELKEEVSLARLPEVFERFAITAQQQKLTVAINGKHVAYPELLLADLRQIKKVEVKGYDVTSPYRWTFDEEYLNIVTVQ